MKIYEIIKERREDFRISLKELSKKTGIELPVLYAFEQNNKDIDTGQLEKIMKILKLVIW